MNNLDILASYWRIKIIAVEWKSNCVPVVLDTVRSCQLQVLLFFLFLISLCIYCHLMHLKSILSTSFILSRIV